MVPVSSKNEYEIAVSIVVYQNDRKELSTILESLRISKRRLMITVVDNSPTPALRATAKLAGAEYIFVGENIGFGAGHNLAIRRSLELAPYHAVVNPDVIVGEDTFDRLIALMDAHPEVGQAMPAVYYADGREQRLAKRLPTPVDLFLRRFLGPVGKRLAKGHWDHYELRDIDLTVTREVPCLSGCFMFLRTTTLRQIGLFDERYFMYMEDVDLCRRIGDVSLTVICPDAKICHGYSKGSYRNLRLLWFHTLSAIGYFGKWGWIWDRTRSSRNNRTAPL